MANSRVDAVRVNLLGVPDSAGAYCVGVDEAPSALRAAGLIEALTHANCDVRDHGDLTLRKWTPDRRNRFAQNLGEETEAMGELADAASKLLALDAKLLVIGGACTVALGLSAAVTQQGERPRLIYVDRHLDLNTPNSTLEGSLSWMGMAHALALEGTAPELAALTGRTPLLRGPDLVYLGVELEQATDWERSQAEAVGLHVVTQAELCENPSSAANAARGHLTGGPFLVHLDVDVLDFIDAPLAENVNGRNSGPTVGQLGQALTVLLGDPECRGLSIGQLTPAHVASDPTALPRLITALAGAFGGAR